MHIKKRGVSGAKIVFKCTLYTFVDAFDYVYHAVSAIQVLFFHCVQRGI